MHTVASLLPAPNVARNWIGRAPVHTHWRKVFKFKDHQCIYRRKSLQFSSVYALMLFSFWMSCHMWCRQETFLQCVWTGAFPIWILLHVLQAKGCLQCLCINALPMWTSCHIWGSQKVFLQCVWGYAFSLKSLYTCSMFFTSVYDLMLTTAYCG